MRAIEIITDAYRRCNRLSPGETLSADDAAFGFERLAMLVDELGARTLSMYKEVLTSAAQSGSIVLGVGSWAAIAPGSEIVSAVCENLPLDEITVQRYNEQYRPFTTGTPEVYAHDGLSTVFLAPIPTGQTITLQTRQSVSAFADQQTEYTVPPGWKNALGAALAVRIAPNIIGGVPPELYRAEKTAMAVVDNYVPAIVDVVGYSQTQVCERRLF